MSGSSLKNQHHNPYQVTVAVPELESIQPLTGIGRVFNGIRRNWTGRIQLVPARYTVLKLPILRNRPYQLQFPHDTDLILLPKLTGAQVLQKTGDVPGITIVHDIGIIDFPGDREGIDRITYQSILGGLKGLRFSTRIVAVSKFTAMRLLHHFPELDGRIDVIHNGVEDIFLTYQKSREFAQEGVRKILVSEPKYPLLIYTGSEIPRKNITLLLDVFTEVKHVHPEAQLIKAGSAGDEKWRKRTINYARMLGLQINKDIFFIDKVTDEELADLYASADVFISASRYEGFGLPALEALATGTPAVVTNCGSFPETVGGVGYIANGTVGELTQSVLNALSVSRNNESRIKYKEWALQYSWNKASQLYLDLICAVSGSRSVVSVKQ